MKALGCLVVGRRQTAAALKCQAAETIGRAPWRRRDQGPRRRPGPRSSRVEEPCGLQPHRYRRRPCSGWQQKRAGSSAHTVPDPDPVPVTASATCDTPHDVGGARAAESHRPGFECRPTRLMPRSSVLASLSLSFPVPRRMVVLEHSSRERTGVRPGASEHSLSTDPSASRPSGPGVPALPHRPRALGSTPRLPEGLQGRPLGSLPWVEDAGLTPSSNKCQSGRGLSKKGGERWREGGSTRHVAWSEALEVADSPLWKLGRKMQQKKGGQKGSEGPALGREAPHPTPHRRDLGAE